MWVDVTECANGRFRRSVKVGASRHSRKPARRRRSSRCSSYGSRSADGHAAGPTDRDGSSRDRSTSRKPGRSRSSAPRRNRRPARLSPRNRRPAPPRSRKPAHSSRCSGGSRRAGGRADGPTGRDGGSNRRTDCSTTVPGRSTTARNIHRDGGRPGRWWRRPGSASRTPRWQTNAISSSSSFRATRGDNIGLPAPAACLRRPSRRVRPILGAAVRGPLTN